MEKNNKILLFFFVLVSSAINLRAVRDQRNVTKPRIKEILNKYQLKNFLDATRKGPKEVVEELLECGIDVNRKNEEGVTGLMVTATDSKLFEKGRLLIRYNVAVNATDKNGWTALMYAAYWKNPLMVGLLIASKVDINKQDKGGETALMKAARVDSMEMVMQLLLEPEIKIGLQDKFGKTALDFAKRVGEEQGYTAANLLFCGEAIEKVSRQSGVKILQKKDERKKFFYGILNEASKKKEKLKITQ